MPEATQAAPATPEVVAPPQTNVVKPGAYKGVDWDAVLAKAPAEPVEADGDAPPPEAEAGAEAAPAPEVKAEEPKPEEKKPEPLAKAFAELSKREAKFQQQTKQREAEFKQREMELAEKQAAVQNLLDDPLAYLEKLGVTYDTLTEQLLNNKKPPADLKHRSEMKKQSDALEALKKDIADKEAARAAAETGARVQQFKAQLVADVTSAGEKYELVNALGEHDMVFDLIDAYAVKHGKILPTEEAAAQVEAHLEERLAKQHERALTTKKWAAKMQPKPAHQPASGGQSAIQGRTPKTLTAANAVAVSGVSAKPLTDAERRAKAAAILSSGAPD
jgi:hypothetical protein